MNIVKIDNKQLSNVIPLYIEVFNSEPWKDSWRTEQAKIRWTELLATPNFIGLGCIVEGELVGVSAGNKETWSSGQQFFIKEMFVKPTYQSKQIGKQLLAQLEILLQKQNVSLLYLITKRDGQAASFYRKNDFHLDQMHGCMIKELS